MDEETKAYLMQEIPKGEYLWRAFGENSPQAKKVIIPTLTQMYWLLNAELATIAQSLGYGLKQNEWPDSKPLEALSRELPGIEATEWYQMQLGEIILPTGHLWVTLTSTSAKQNPSPSPELSANQWDKHDRLILRNNNGERYDVNDELMSIKKIEGKTIRSVITNGEKSIRNYHVRLDFTDGTHIDFLKCDPYQLYNDNQVGKIFLTLWDKAGTKEYDKNEWMYFQELLASRGVNV